MPSLLPAIAHRSRFLLDWDAAHCLAAKEQVLDARTGQVATFSRASVKYALDAAGRYRAVAHSLGAFEWSTDPVTGLSVPGLVLEEASTNLVVQSDLCTVANGWTATGSLTAAANLTYAGRPFTFINNATGGDLSRTVVFTGNGTKAFSFLIRADGAVTGTARLVVYDATAAASRAIIQVTIAAGGVVSAAAVTGTVLLVRALANGVYRIYAQAPGVVAANTHTVFPCNPAGTTATSYLVSGVQVENRAFPSSLTPTTTATVTRAADALTLLNNSLPGALTFYARFADFSALDGAAVTNASISVPGTAAAVHLFRDASSGYSATRYGATLAGAGVAAAVAPGTLIEARVAVTATGAITFGLSTNGGAESTAASANTRTPDSAYGDTNVYIGVEPAQGGHATSAFQSVRIAAGVQSMAFMQAG